MLGIAEHGGPGGDEQLRYLVVVEILPDRGVGRGAQGVEQERDLLLLDEAADLLDRLGRTVAVVETDQVDLAAVDAARFVDHLEIGGFGLADHAVGRGRPAIGHGLADLDFGIGDPGGVVRAGGPGASRQGARRGGARSQECTTRFHKILPFRLHGAFAPPSLGSVAPAASRTRDAHDDPHQRPDRAHGARGHQGHDQDQQYAIDRPGQSLRALAEIDRELVGVIGHEFDE